MRRKDEDFDEDDDEEEEDEAPRRSWIRWTLFLALAGFGIALGFAIPYVWVLDGEVRDNPSVSCSGRCRRRSTRIAAQARRRGKRMDAPTLLLELEAGQLPATMAVGNTIRAPICSDGDRFRIGSRGFQRYRRRR